MESAVTLRRATLDDVPRVLALIAAGGTSAKAHGDELSSPPVACYREAFEEIAANPRQALVVAEVDGAVVGTLQFIAFRHLHHRGGFVAEVEAVHVAEPMR